MTLAVLLRRYLRLVDVVMRAAMLRDFYDQLDMLELRRRPRLVEADVVLVEVVIVVLVLDWSCFGFAAVVVLLL